MPYAAKAEPGMDSEDGPDVREQLARAHVEAEARAARAGALAETLQRSLLPQRLPEVPGIGLAARYLPGGGGAEVGGDWYDVFSLGGGPVGLAIGDVVGSGVGAASLMGQLRSAVRAYMVEGHGPAAVLERLNFVLHTYDGPLMATALVALVEPETWTVRFASAGHPPPLVRSPGGEATFLDSRGSIPLGAVARATYEDRVAAIEPGSTLLIYTDGLLEARGATLEDGLERLRGAVERGGASNPERLCDGVLEATVGGEVPEDDAALVALEAQPALGERLELRLPAEPEALALLRRALGRWLGEASAGAEESYEISVACGEACANAIEHAYSPGDAHFEVEAELSAGEAALTVRDSGSWRQPRGADRGRGIELMKALMDTVEVEPGEGGTTVRMRRRLGGGRR